jgi:hypothetical protein
MRHPLRLPAKMVLGDRVQDRQQLPHTGRQGHLRRLARAAQAFVERVEHRMIAPRHEGAHLPGGPHGSTAPPDRPAAPAGAAVTSHGGHPTQGGQPLAAPRAHLRPVAPPRTGTDRAHTRDAAAPCLARTPHRPCPPRRVEVVIPRRQPGVEPGARRLNVRREPWGGTAEAVLFGRPHGHQLPPPREQGAECIGLGVRQGPGGGRPASATCAKARAARAAVVANCPVALAKSRAWRGLTTATGRPLAANAATTARW